MLDESGFPLAGATIQEKETANGAIADSEGKFTLVVADNAVLRVSFIGYISQDIEVEGRSTFHITLREDMIELDNVIVTAGVAAVAYTVKEHILLFTLLISGGNLSSYFMLLLTHILPSAVLTGGFAALAHVIFKKVLFKSLWHRDIDSRE